MKLRQWSSLAVVLFVLALSQSLYGQSQGGLVGTVRDATGAVIPGAEVVATRNETGIAQYAKTTEDGDYRFPNLPVGTYTLVVSAMSFQELKVERIEIHVATTVRQDAILQVASVAAGVEIIASTPLVKSETSEIGQLVNSQQISELPINGRNIYQLLRLTAGSESGVGGGLRVTSSTRPAIAGGRAGNTRFSIDGLDVTTQNIPGAGVQPNLDAVQEFRAITQLAPASYSSSSSVQLALKSGTNQFHGTAYEFFRNNVLDAHPYFQRNIVTPAFTSTPAQLRYNQFGATIGGPVKRNRAFFFFGFQRQLQNTVTQYTNLEPTAQMLAGDFTGINPVTQKPFGPVFDPVTGKQFSNNGVANVIPPNRIHAIAKKFADVSFAAPNCVPCLQQGLGFNYVGNAPAFDRYAQYLTRFDLRITDNDSFFANFVRMPSNLTNSSAFTGKASPIKAEQLHNANIPQMATLGWTHTFTPALLNEVRLGYTRLPQFTEQDHSADGAFTFKNTPFSDKTLFPTINIGGYGFFGSQYLSQSIRAVEESYHLTDNVTWIRGSHQFKAGFETSRDHFYVKSNLNAFMVFADGLPAIFGFTGNGFSDFLLGVPLVALTTQGIGRANLIERSRYGVYLQDDWKVNARLTLNLGLRWEYQQRWHDGDTTLNRLGALDTSAASKAAGGRFLLAGSPNVYIPGKGVVSGGSSPLVRNSLTDPAWRDFMPRVGLAYRPFNNNKTAIRAGFGIYYTVPDGFLASQEAVSPPFQYYQSIVNLPPNVPFGQPFTYDTLWPASSPQGVGCCGYDIRNRDPRTYQWTLGVEREVWKDFLLSLEYLGNRGDKLPLSILINEATLPNAAQLAELKANPALSAGAAAARSPFPGVGQGYTYTTNIGFSNYHALNMKAEKRFAQGFVLSAVYTWSKALDNASAEQIFPNTVYNLGLSKSYSDYDHPHRFVASWVYKLPFGEKYIVPRNAVLKKIVSGWESSGIATFEAGPPFSVTTGADTSFRSSGTDYPNLTGKPVFSDIRATNGIYLTPTNFTAAPFGQIGSFPRNGLRGPGVNNFDLGLMKNTSVTEKLNAQFRVELFNAFNHAQFNIGNQTLATGLLPPPAGSTEPVVQYKVASQFGRASARGTRVIQLGLKLVF